jgi:hypothetical protein
MKKKKKRYELAPQDSCIEVWSPAGGTIWKGSRKVSRWWLAGESRSLGVCPEPCVSPRSSLSLSLSLCVSVCLSVCLLFSMMWVALQHHTLPTMMDWNIWMHEPKVALPPFSCYFKYFVTIMRKLIHQLMKK